MTFLQEFQVRGGIRVFVGTTARVVIYGIIHLNIEDQVQLPMQTLEVGGHMIHIKFRFSLLHERTVL